jgi:hypothetical protein
MRSFLFLSIFIYIIIVGLTVVYIYHEKNQLALYTFVAGLMIGSAFFIAVRRVSNCDIKAGGEVEESIVEEVKEENKESINKEVEECVVINND